MKKRLFAMLLVSILCVGASLAANSYSENITVTYGIDLKFNNELVALKDGSGKIVQPFVYNGTTYVPIRAVSENLGADVSYDASNNTAYIYNDYAEICVLVNKMDGIITDYYTLINQEILAVSSNSMNVHSHLIRQMEDRIETIGSAFQILLSKDGYNTYAETVVENVSPYFYKCTVSCLEMATSYEVYRLNRNQTNLNAFIDKYSTVAENYYSAQNAIDTFYASFGLWRDIGI